MSTFALKMTALVLMVLDHIGFYFPGMPVWFGWLGRAAYPLFLFCMAWGYHYTKSRKKYLLRLYLMSLFMTALGWTLDQIFPTESGYGNHNIFVPLLLVGVLISTVETLCQDRKRGLWMLCGVVGSQILYSLLPTFVPALRAVSGDVLTGIVPSLFVNEYGLPFVLLGVLFYFVRERKDLLCAVYLLFCLGEFISEMLEYGVLSQSFMVLALPLLLCYNRQKGRGMKYFFYFFYPAHTALLFFLANRAI